MTTVKGERKEENQIVRTPREFIYAVEARFGGIVADLAANAENAIAPVYFGQGSQHGEDSLTANWRRLGSLAGIGLRWLNPPYSDRAQPIARWAMKCAEMRGKVDGPIAFLVPAAVCTTWFRRHVAPHAYVFELFPRVFDKQIRDCILALYTPEGYVGREPWDWKD
jgi:phage N-6-adenine-methyltransferase